jgi:hypothetical protein
VTIRVDGKEPREVVVPGWYLDGRRRGERNRRVDLAYATTGHRAQGLTRWRALVRLTGPEPQGPPSWTCPTGRSSSRWPTRAPTAATPPRRSR